MRSCDVLSFAFELLFFVHRMSIECFALYKHFELLVQAFIAVRLLVDLM